MCCASRAKWKSGFRLSLYPLIAAKAAIQRTKFPKGRRAICALHVLSDHRVRFKMHSLRRRTSWIEPSALFSQFKLRRKRRGFLVVGAWRPVCSRQQHAAACSLGARTGTIGCRQYSSLWCRLNRISFAPAQPGGRHAAANREMGRACGRRMSGRRSHVGACRDTHCRRQSRCNRRAECNGDHSAGDPAQVPPRKVARAKSPRANPSPDGAAGQSNTTRTRCLRHFGCRCLPGALVDNSQAARPLRTRKHRKS
jgi:hypothetical protein